MSDAFDTDKTMLPSNNPYPPGQFSPGTTLGQYRIIKLLGRGGMGEVYEVEHQVLRRRYALKLLSPDFASRPGDLDRFQREAQVMANLQHQNIIRVDEFGETEGRYWLRMERATGLVVGDLLFSADENRDRSIVSLQDLANAGNGKIPQELLLEILKQIAEGLAYAHEHGAVHRDLKPSNILLSQHTLNRKHSPPPLGVKISDFGLVRLVGEEWVRSQAQISVQRSLSMGQEKTASPEGASTRSLLGTYEYMSPEQKRGEEADERSDMYSLGLMTFKLLTGRNPGTKPPSRIDKQLAQGWDDVVAESLEDERAERLASCGAFLSLLEVVATEIREEATQQVRRPTPRLKPQNVKETGAIEGQAWTSPSTLMEFLWIGALDMWVGQYPVTNGEYRQYKPNHDSKAYGGHSLNGDRQPVVYVNFDDGRGYTEWLTERDRASGTLPAGCRYRLPSEQEWMTFAQCGDDREYPWGKSWPPPSDWNYDGSNDEYPATCPVEKSGRNDWGIYGVGGNVWEMAAQDNTGSLFGAWRGASWSYIIKGSLRCSARVGRDGSHRDGNGGFRLVLSRR